MNRKTLKLLCLTVMIVSVVFSLIACNNQITVKFDANGGTFEKGTVSEQQVKRNRCAEVPAEPIREGYTFIGWKVDGSDGFWNFETKIKEELTLYAVWEINPRLESIDGATFANDTVTLYVNNDVTRWDLTNKVHAVGGEWKLSYDTSGNDVITDRIAKNKDGTLAEGNNDFYVSVYSDKLNKTAVYRLIIHRVYNVDVTYYVDGSPVRNEQSLTNSVCEFNYIPEKDGYEFVCWKNSKGEAVTSQTLYAPISLYAEFKIKTYKATLDFGNGQANGSQNIEYKASYKLPVPVKKGHTFLGWYLDGTMVAGSDGEGLAAWTYLEDKTFCAKYSVNEYSVTLLRNDSDRGTVEGAGVFDYGSEVTIKAVNKIKFVFVGWFDGETLISSSREYTFNMPDADLTYTAKWNPDGELEKFIYETRGDVVIITGVKGDPTALTVPEYAAEIKENTFADCTNLQSITVDGANPYFSSVFGVLFNKEQTEVLHMPQQVSDVVLPDAFVNIPDNLFGECKRLRSVVFGNNVSAVDTNLFVENRSFLTSVTLGRNMTNFKGLFDGCFALTDVTVNMRVCNIYAGDIFPNSPIEKITFSDSVEILNGSFTGLLTLKEVIIGGGVKTFGDQVFNGCGNLSKLTVKHGVSAIGNSAFRECGSLTEVILPDSCTAVGEYAFADCGKLASVTFSSGLQTVGAHAFENCALSRAEFGSEIKSIDTAAFYNCKSLRSVTFNVSAKDVTIGDSSFCNCDALATLTLNNCVSRIKARAFGGCVTLLDFELSNTLYEIGELAFENCRALTKIEFPSSLTAVYGNSYRLCRGVESISIAENEKYYVQDNCLIVKEIKELVLCCKNSALPQDITVIGDDMFYGMNLESIDIPAGVQRIGNNAFRDCSKLKTVVLHDGLKYIGATAFYNCGSLSEIIIPDSVTSIGTEAFRFCAAADKIVIGNGIKTLDEKVFDSCRNVQYVIIGTDVEEIKFAAFNDCGMETVFFRCSKDEYGRILIDEASNEFFLKANFYYYSDTNTDGEYWHYVDGVPTPWAVSA